MVCMGNICRSPTAEAVFRQRLQAAGLAHRVDVDSAGTHGYHIGSPPDERSQMHAQRRGYDLSVLRARQVNPSDYLRFDLLLAMDADNLRLLKQGQPAQVGEGKLCCLTDFLVPGGRFHGAQAVPDPYYGGPEGFEHVLDLVEAACDGLMLHVRQALQVP